MTIQFCVIRERATGKFICHKEEIWGHGSTMTGPMSSTVFELESLSNLMGTWTSDHFTMFENAKAAQEWISSKQGLSFISAQQAHYSRQKPIINLSLEVVTFADIDSIIEQQLLGDDNQIT